MFQKSLWNLCCCGNSHKDEASAPLSLEPKSIIPATIEEKEHAVVLQLEVLATKLSRTVQKFPKSNKRLFRNARDRYIAPVPVDDHSLNMTDLERWRKGWLAYWESREDCEQGLSPKGFISLWKIAKVHHSKDGYEGCAVVVSYEKKHDDNVRERSQMWLVFSSVHEAREFSYQFWEFLAKLRCRWDDRMPATVKSGTSSQSTACAGGG